MPNSLISEKSLYLQQHAHNPVQWYAWGKEAIEKARTENKALIISIGYSACHWCHVMEKECFENDEVANIMNRDFVCIKVDREERPDLDTLYMEAVQLMTGQGGWPLNVIALPDGRPFYGGTYFPKNKWIEVLQKLSAEYKRNPDLVLEYAVKLSEGVKASNLFKAENATESLQNDTLHACVNLWKPKFDTLDGGPNRAPKFPLPNNYSFLLQYAFLNEDEKLKKHVYLTLDKMACGGIYDQVGGGFARYSTDVYWKVPHFEKMLYDNAQLIGLYADAYRATKSSLYKHIVYQSIAFLQDEFSGIEGNFYSAIDADSEGEEGKYYVFTENELIEICGELYADFLLYFEISNASYWENGNYIIMRKVQAIELSYSEQKKLNELIILLKTARNKRPNPTLDKKSICSWNAMTISGLAKAYKAFNENMFLEMALKNVQFVRAVFLENHKLKHVFYEGEASVSGFLEDYAFCIQAWLDMYEITSDEQYIAEAELLMQSCMQDFFNEERQMFFFTSKNEEKLFSQSVEYLDNVIPASNSVMAHNIHTLGIITGNSNYLQTADKMLKNVLSMIAKYGSSFSNWAMLLMQKVLPYYEIAIVGPNAKAIQQELNAYYLPNVLINASEKESKLPLFFKRYKQGQTLLYVCENNACKNPVLNLKEALELIKNKTKNNT
jgi:uncharacterized protein YyaL (SSP411 family)